MFLIRSFSLQTRNFLFLRKNLKRTFQFKKGSFTFFRTWQNVLLILFHENFVFLEEKVKKTSETFPFFNSKPFLRRTKTFRFSHPLIEYFLQIFFPWDQLL